MRDYTLKRRDLHSSHTLGCPGRNNSDQRKSQLHHFTIGFQKPGICVDSWFLESNGKMVQLGFSLIKNRAPHGAGLVPTGLYFLLPVIRINLQVLAGSGGMIVLWLNRVYLETRELNPRNSIFDQRKSQLHHFTIGFQKPGICADSWFLESNGKMVQLGFSLIK
jgi:hypothetical protein